MGETIALGATEKAAMDAAATEQIARLFTQVQDIAQGLETIAVLLATARASVAQAAATLAVAEQQRVALHKRLVQQEDGYVLRQCAWCGVHLGIMWTGTCIANAITHGMCPACAQRVFGVDTARPTSAPRDEPGRTS